MMLSIKIMENGETNKIKRKYDKRFLEIAHSQFSSSEVTSVT